MYLAELHGKLSQYNENKEDILTSNVFSFFKYADRAVFLRLYLRSLGLAITVEDARQAEFYFWPRYADNTEPDLVVLAGKYYLLFEAKYFSGFGEESLTTRHQLVREIEGGEHEAHNLDKVFQVIAITAHYTYQPNILNGMPDVYKDRIRWTNWQHVTWLLESQLEKTPELTPETRLFATDLYQLLLRKKLRSFMGAVALKATKPVHHSPNTLFFQACTARYRGDFIGFESALAGQKHITQLPKRLFFVQKHFFSRLPESIWLRQPPQTSIFFRSEQHE